MSWRTVFRPEVETDVAEAAAWYEARQQGLGLRFVEEVFQIWRALVENPLLNARRHPTKNIRWRYPPHFPYRIVYEVDETRREVVVLAVLHAARHDRHWLKRERPPS
jgi:plasmid stabilization system protein ParE